MKIIRLRRELYASSSHSDAKVNHPFDMKSIYFCLVRGNFVFRMSLGNLKINQLFDYGYASIL